MIVDRIEQSGIDAACIGRGAPLTGEAIYLEGPNKPQTAEIKELVASSC